MITLIPLRSKDIDLSDTKIMENILIFGVEVNFWKTYRIGAIFVVGGVQGGKIHIGNLFSLSSRVL